MVFKRLLAVPAALLVGLFISITPSLAQQDALPVLILPVDQAQFLPGAHFDFRVEVHAPELPENFAVTVNGTPAAEYFGADATEENWEFGGKVSTVATDGTPAEDFALENLAGDYYNIQFGKVTVTVDGETVSSSMGDDVTLTRTDDTAAYAFNVAGGAADGQVLTFGFDKDSKLTGFTVAGQNFGILTTLPTKASSVIWRGLTAPEPGDYTVEVTAGGTTKSVTWTVRAPIAGKAKNVIVFIADGMTIPEITAARAARGIKEGRPTNELAMDGFKVIGLASTSSVDSLMMDSANTASAINTGHIGSINATGTYSDTSPSKLDDPRVETFAELVKRTRGMAVGIVTTADFSDATPAAVWSHGRDRSDSNRADYLLQALDFGPDVLMGGGSRRMLPSTVEGSRRTDDHDLFAEYEAAGYTIVTNKTEMDTAFDGDTIPEKVVGVFHPNDMNVWLDRNVYTDNLGDFKDQPGLVDMTLAALEVVNQNPNGFYLEVEAASVDKQMHPLDQERALSDLIEFDQAIAAAEAWVAENAPDTLIVVTADHAHGYEVYGMVNVEKFNEATDDAGRRNAIIGSGYPNYPDANGDGFPEWGDATVVLAGVVNNHPDYTEDFQVSETPRVPAIVNEEGIAVDNPDDDPNGMAMSGDIAMTGTTGGHTLQDVPVFAAGPGSEALMGTYHQSEIFFALTSAIGLDPSAEDGIAK